jgi:hypothetical protein
MVVLGGLAIENQLGWRNSKRHNHCKGETEEVWLSHLLSPCWSELINVLMHGLMHGLMRAST